MCLFVLKVFVFYHWKLSFFFPFTFVMKRRKKQRMRRRVSSTEVSSLLIFQLNTSQQQLDNKLKRTLGLTLYGNIIIFLLAKIPFPTKEKNEVKVKFSTSFRFFSRSSDQFFCLQPLSLITSAILPCHKGRGGEEGDCLKKKPFAFLWCFFSKLKHNETRKN